MPILTAPEIGSRNFGSKLSGACFCAKLIPCTATSSAPPLSVTASARPLKTLTEFRQRKLVGDARFRVVIAANDKGPNPGFVQPPQLIGEKAGSLHRGLFAVVEVAGDQESVDLLGKAEINHVGEGFSRRPADQLGKRRLAQRQGAQRRIEVDVGGMNESERHGRIER